MSPSIEAGLNITAIGIGVVFVLLTLLVYIIRGMSALARLLEGRAAQTPTAAVPQAAASNQELISVIGAAIAAHRRQHRSPGRKP